MILMRQMPHMPQRPPTVVEVKPWSEVGVVIALGGMPERR
jgi:hypothetical protein